jgi:hypothetical protein
MSEPNLIPGAVYEVAADADIPTARVQWMGGQRFRLAELYPVHDERHDRRWTIPALFEFDGASIPRPVWPLISPIDCGLIAVLCHDYLYRRAGLVGRAPYTRTEADLLFRDQMHAEGVPLWRRWPAYQAVRWFGGGAWRAR